MAEDEEKDPEFRKRFFLEAATVAKLSHPNTVTIFDYGQSDGLYFIAMELIDGETLKKFTLGNKGDADKALEIVRAGGYSVASVEAKPVKRNPPPPFIRPPLEPCVFAHPKLLTPCGCFRFLPPLGG